MPSISFLKAITPVVNSTSNSIALTYSISPGDFVVVSVGQYTTVTGAITVTDDGPNTYSPGPLIQPAGSPGILSFYAGATHAATTITVNVASFTNSWSAGAVTYSNVNNAGNTGNVNNSTSSTTKSISGTLASASNWMAASIAQRGGIGASSPPAIGGSTVRAWNNVGAVSNMALLDNTGATSLTCGYTTGASGISVGIFIELVALPPHLTSISPSTGTQGVTVPVTITGSSLTGATAVNLSGSGITVANPVVVNDTTITANFVIASSATVGSQNVTVVTPTGTSNTVSFTIQSAATAPSLSSISPNAGTQGITVPVTITGVNLTGATAVNVTGTGITVTNLVVVNATTITASFVIASNAGVAVQSVTVVTPGGTSNPVNFEVQNAVAAGVNLLAVAATLTLINN